MLEVGGVVYEEDEEVRHQIVQFYENLHLETEGWRPKVDGLNLASIGEDECRMLERPLDRKSVV